MSMENFSKKEKAISPEEFFDSKIEVYRVTKQNFYNLIKERNPEMDDDKILQAKGTNIEMNGKVVILLRTDVFPEEYMPYLETHEKWEAYIARKNGFNLWDRSVREYKKDKEIIDLNQEDDKQDFYREIAMYNYDFRHEYAIFKEYQQALEDGKLEEYHNWFLKQREREIEETESLDNLDLIENDTKIRRSIYDKLTTGTKHYFTKNEIE